MSVVRRRFTAEFKHKVLQEIQGGKGMGQVCRQYQLDPKMVRSWRKLLNEHGSKAFSGNGNPYREEARIAELERLIGQQAIEISFLKKALASCSQLARSAKTTTKKP